jgi:hypothetical protein
MDWIKLVCSVIQKYLVYRIMWDLWWTEWHWAVFLRVFRFSRPILIPPNAPYSSTILSCIHSMQKYMEFLYQHRIWSRRGKNTNRLHRFGGSLKGH